MTTAVTSQAVPTMRQSYSSGLREGAVGERVIPVSNLSAWQVALLRALAPLGALHANWDSYGSPAIDDSVIDGAVALIRNVGLENVSAPRVIPISGGGVQFEWEKGRRGLEVEIHPDKTVAVLIADGDAMFEFPRMRLQDLSLEKLLLWLDAA
jgi:hypothetical protein